MNERMETTIPAIEEPTEATALEVAHLIHHGALSAREVVESALQRIDHHRALNAFTLVDADGALAAAAVIGPGDPRPLAGVPVAVKELTPVAGQPFTAGSALYGDYRATHDAYVVRRLRQAGCIIIGRTNAPEFGIVPTTEPRRFGATRNPWDRSRTPGGSSGGAAAAVAARLVPLAQASDGGGSIRIPAACCGLVGLKPSRGRISSGPTQGHDLFTVNGVLTRTIAESATLLDLLSGYELGDATWAPPPPEPFAATAARPPRRLHIAFTTLSPVATTVDPLCAQAVQSAAHLLATLGHSVVEVAPPRWVEPRIQDRFSTVWAAGVASAVRGAAAASGRPPEAALTERLTWAYYERGLQLSAVALLEAQADLERYARDLVTFFADYDLLLTPALGGRPLSIGALDTDAADPLAEFEKAIAFSPFTAVWNVTGQPALALPLYHGSDGLPLAVQLVGPPLGDGLLLALGGELEAALPWAGRRPPL